MLAWEPDQSTELMVYFLWQICPGLIWWLTEEQYWSRYRKFQCTHFFYPSASHQQVNKLTKLRTCCQPTQGWLSMHQYHVTEICYAIHTLEESTAVNSTTCDQIIIVLVEIRPSTLPAYMCNWASCDRFCPCDWLPGPKNCSHILCTIVFVQPTELWPILHHSPDNPHLNSRETGFYLRKRLTLQKMGDKSWRENQANKNCPIGVFVCKKPFLLRTMLIPCTPFFRRGDCIKIILHILHNHINTKAHKQEGTNIFIHSDKHSSMLTCTHIDRQKQVYPL